MKQGKVNIKRLILMLTAFTVLLFTIVSFIILMVNELPLVESNGVIFVSIYAVLFILLSAATTISVAMFIKGQDQIKTLRSSNIYHFGVDNLFYNYPMFQDKVRFLRAINRSKAKGYVICFTLMASSETKDLNPNEKALNRYMTEYLLDVLVKDQVYGKNMATCCFYRGCFFIYSFLDLEHTHEMIEGINKRIFELVKEHELMLFAQPHFGVTEISNSVDLVQAFDEAMLARNFADRNFEEITFYREEFREVIKQDEIKELQEAIINKEFVVYYQPKFHLKSKEFVGSEALVRWNSPRYGLVQPAKFIKKAEVGGLIHEIDMYVLKQVIKDLQAQKSSGKRLLPVSINFSLYEFFSSSFLVDLKRMIDESKLDPRLIEIEITETTSQANSFMAVTILKKLKDYGLKILMDDFGSGFSNIAQLNKLPIDVVKIDKSFIDGLTVDTKNCEIVKFLISLCKVNNLEVIAEGVDSKAEIQILEKAKCDVIQGYYYSEPLPLDDYITFLKENKFEKKGDRKR